jgi:tetratricopeptide (TPR) repeat protein
MYKQTCEAKALGRDHPDVAITLCSLGLALKEIGDLPAGLAAKDRAAAMISPSSELVANVLVNRSEVLLALGRYSEAENSLKSALVGLEGRGDPESVVVAYPLSLLGDLKLAIGDPSNALPYFERALRIRERSESEQTLIAEMRFGLARALWESGGDRVRSLSLARAACETYERKSDRSTRTLSIRGWLPIPRATTREPIEDPETLQAARARRRSVASGPVGDREQI